MQNLPKSPSGPCSYLQWACGRKTELASEAFERITHSLQSPPALTANRRQDRSAARVAVLAACLLLIWVRFMHSGLGRSWMATTKSWSKTFLRHLIRDRQKALRMRNQACLKCNSQPSRRKKVWRRSRKLIPVRVTNP